MADQSIEMERIDPGEKMKEIKNLVENNKKQINKYGRFTTTIVIPMLGILILCAALMIGVLSGYIIRLKSHESGQIDTLNAGILCFSGSFVHRDLNSNLHNNFWTGL